MLKLKRVEVQGFKSFCDRTEMRFNGAGIAAIVGPNGCGKSNLSDAISWVLGEQSAKSLRGSRMQDVIFAGTSARKPVGMAAVTMTLVDPAYHLENLSKVNGNGHGHAENGSNGTNGHNGANGHDSRKPREITITRRLFRSGESEYLVDGKLARLRDIQDLFMGTGLGPESYAIIEQGRIGQILSSRPHDRRAIIEEAAGISRFKAKRRLAEARLEGARQNLSRVFDILEEVGRQVNSLNRQAKKAERYKRYHADLLVQLRRTLSGRFRLLEGETARTSVALEEASKAHQELTAAVLEKEREQSASREEAYAREQELTEIRRRVSELRLQGERTCGRIESQARQIQDIELRLTQGETETRSLEKRSVDLEQQLADHGTALEELETQTRQAVETLRAKQEERQQAQAQLGRQEQAIETARKTVLRLLGESGHLKNQLAQIDSYLESVGRDSARLEKEREASEEELKRLGALQDEVADNLHQRRRQLESVVQERQTVDAELKERRGGLNEARRELNQLREETSQLRARKQSLDEILSHRAYTTESVKRFFTAVEQDRQRELQPLGVLADFVDVDPDYEKAAEEFLHDELEYIVVRNWEQAGRGVELMRRELDGRATFLVHPEPDVTITGCCEEPPLGPETGIVKRLSSVLRMTNGLTHAPTEMVPRIARCLIAEDAAAAQRLAQQYPDFYFLLADGVCYHGYAVSGGKKTVGGPLALKRELRDVTATLQGRQGDLEKLQQRVTTLENEIGVLEERLETLRTEQQSHEKEVVAIEAETRKLDEEFTRAEHRRSLAGGEIERLSQEKERSLARREEFRTQIEEKESARLAEEKALEETRQRLEELQKQAARLSEEHSALRVELAEREERRRAVQLARQRVESQKQEIETRRTDVRKELERLGVERARLLEDNIELDKKAGELTEQLATSEKAAGELEGEVAALREHLTAMDESLKRLRGEVQEAQERRSQVEVALAERRSDRKHLEETCIKELRMTLPDLAEAEPEELDEEALAEAEQEYERLKSRIENLGAVNPAALEEYEEAKQRYDFLNAQRQDLLDSIRDTEKAIKEIDTETKRRFNHAFEAINENFKHTFQTLFGGGAGEMRLADPSNPGESGIDIVASPPGKRLQNVLLLSGGEKALTALALLMAIFQFQPSPFCILDEVDAPLDEANIQRMIRLLKGMAGQTQFVVITHAKSTMQAAESLYGVTMQEPGVSKLVSVRFQPLPEATVAVGQAVTAPPS